MTKLTAGQEVEVPGFILLSGYGTAMHCAIELNGYTTLMPHVLKFTVPTDYNPVATELAALEKTLDSMADAYHSGVAKIKDRIAQLQCIELSEVVG